MAKVFSVELSDGANRFAELTLPATDYELLDALDKLQLQPGASPQWEIYEYTHFQYLDSFESINDYAQTVKEIQDAGELTKFKAVMTAKGCTTISEALQIADQLDQYIFEPKVSTAEDVARDEIQASVSVQSIDSLIKHVNLYAYGRELIEEYGSKLTSFGLVTPRDGLELEAVNQTGPQLSM